MIDNIIHAAIIMTTPVLLAALGGLVNRVGGLVNIGPVSYTHLKDVFQVRLCQAQIFNCATRFANTPQQGLDFVKAG